jgi:hypothetical protein
MLCSRRERFMGGQRLSSSIDQIHSRASRWVNHGHVHGSAFHYRMFAPHARS